MGQQFSMVCHFFMEQESLGVGSHCSIYTHTYTQMLLSRRPALELHPLVAPSGPGSSECAPCRARWQTGNLGHGHRRAFPLDGGTVPCVAVCHLAILSFPPAIGPLGLRGPPLQGARAWIQGSMLSPAGRFELPLPLGLG